MSQFVKGHHHHSRAVTADDLGIGDKLLFALLHGDRVDDGFALHALEASLNDMELGAVHHHGNTGDIWLSSDQIEKGRHGFLGVEQALIHVDVDDLRPVLHLVSRHIERFGILVILDQLAKPG